MENVAFEQLSNNPTDWPTKAFPAWAHLSPPPHPNARAPGAKMLRDERSAALGQQVVKGHGRTLVCEQANDRVANPRPSALYYGPSSIKRHLVIPPP